MKEEAHIREYITTDKNDCIEAFTSNVPYYFAKEEIEDFKDFLFRIENGRDNARFYVVTYNQKVIGCGGFGDKCSNGTFSLAWGFIHSEYHKKGLGEKLLQYRLEEIKKLKPKVEVILDTTQHTEGFYRKYGFQTIKISKDYYAVGLHRHDMAVEI